MRCERHSAGEVVSRTVTRAREREYFESRIYTLSIDYTDSIQLQTKIKIPSAIPDCRFLPAIVISLRMSVWVWYVCVYGSSQGCRGSVLGLMHDGGQFAVSSFHRCWAWGACGISAHSSRF